VAELILEWDARKARKNLRKHKISFDEAKTVLSDPLLLTYPDESHSEIEERYISVGLSAKNRVLLVVYTELCRNTACWVIRIIGCRKATPLERKAYEENE
jgi:uncharacterized protein